jgi:hypothetical protein
MGEGVGTDKIGEGGEGRVYGTNEGESKGCGRGLGG